MCNAKCKHAKYHVVRSITRYSGRQRDEIEYQHFCSISCHVQRIIFRTVYVSGNVVVIGIGNDLSPIPPKPLSNAWLSLVRGHKIVFRGNPLEIDIFQSFKYTRSDLNNLIILTEGRWFINAVLCEYCTISTWRAWHIFCWCGHDATQCNCCSRKLGCLIHWFYLIKNSNCLW